MFSCVFLLIIILNKKYIDKNSYTVFILWIKIRSSKGNKDNKYVHLVYFTNSTGVEVIKLDNYLVARVCFVQAF